MPTGAGAPATLLVLLALLASVASAIGAPPVEAGAPGAPAQSSGPDVRLLAPPKTDGPLVVRGRFDFDDIDEINDGPETFDFTGVLTLTWRDPRLAFDPAEAGVDEKIYQGNYQFDEIATGWWPQVVLVNVSGSFESSGVLLRVRPDGTSTLVQKILATAEVDFEMHRFPIDQQRLDAVFMVLGYDRSEVVFEPEPVAPGAIARNVTLPQWLVTGSELFERERPAAYAGRGGVASTLVARVVVQRETFYISRLILFPLVVIVLLSFSVFWMDRSSLGDRISVSFIGILTGVAYQMVMGDVMPRIAYVTLMHGLLNLSFFVMCATVVMNLVVGALDKRGEFARGDRIDRICRWLFPLVYFGLMAAMVLTAHLLF